MTTIQKKIAIAMLATGMTGAGITMTELAAHAAPAAVVQKDTGVRAVASASSQPDVQRYAARESTSHEQLAYKGGDILVIGVTTTGLVLLLVLALLLV